MEKVRILIADDHPILREGIKAVFSCHPQYQVVGEAANGLETLHKIAALKPDIVFLDISMPELDGILVTSRIAKEFPETKVIILSMHDNPHYAVRAFRAGAMSYILKGGGTEELLTAIKKAISGIRYASPAINDELLSIFAAKEDGEGEQLGSLNLREREIITLITEGDTNKEMAKKLFLSVSTVKNYRSNIMRKLKVKNVAELFKIAMQKHE